MPKQVLIIEDNADNRMIYCVVLEHAGFKVIEAVDGEKGLALAYDVMPDIILLDIGLPGIDGWEVCTQLKADERTKAVPVVAITAHAYKEDRQRGARVGFDEYLAKPIEPRVLLKAVELLIGKS